MLDGKTVTIAGGTNGLSMAMVFALAVGGAAVVAVDLDAAGLGHVRRDSAAQAAGLGADVSDEAAICGVVDACLADHGHVDVVKKRRNRAGGTQREGGGQFPGRSAGGLPTLPVRAHFRRILPQPGCRTAHARPGLGCSVSVTMSPDTKIRGRVSYGPAKAASAALTAVISGDLDRKG
jgi:hypothetical protein